MWILFVFLATIVCAFVKFGIMAGIITTAMVLPILAILFLMKDMFNDNITS